MRARIVTANGATQVDVGDPERAVSLLLELADLSREEIARHRLPSVYASGVRYDMDIGEVWRTPVSVARRRRGDCEDLTVWRVGELWLSGVDPLAAVGLVPTRRGYHALVVRGDGTLEDPSAVLGGRKMRTRIDLARDATGAVYARVAVPVGTDGVAAAHGIGEVVGDALAAAVAELLAGLRGAGVVPDRLAAPLDAIPALPAQVERDLRWLADWVWSWEAGDAPGLRALLRASVGRGVSGHVRAVAGRALREVMHVRTR